MIAREDFIFSIGFEGNTAIVDAQAGKGLRRLSARELAEKGFYKAAVASAVYEKNEAQLAEVLEIYNRNNMKTLDSVEALKRTFGVLENFESIDRVMYV